MFRAGKPHAQGSEPSNTATADGSIAAAASLQEGALAEELQKPSAGALAREQAPDMSSAGAAGYRAAGAEHSRGENDLMVATGYTGRPVPMF